MLAPCTPIFHVRGLIWGFLCERVPRVPRALLGVSPSATRGLLWEASFFLTKKEGGEIGWNCPIAAANSALVQMIQRARSALA